jgi:hypothetical protein
VLYKENKDTTAAVGLLAKFTKYDATFLPFDWSLHCIAFHRAISKNCVLCLFVCANSARASRFSYAGTKDKRGVTTQHMTIYHMRVRCTPGRTPPVVHIGLINILPLLAHHQAEQLRGLNAKLYGMRVGNFSYAPIRTCSIY